MTAGIILGFSFKQKTLTSYPSLFLKTKAKSIHYYSAVQSLERKWPDRHTSHVVNRVESNYRYYFRIFIETEYIDVISSSVLLKKCEKYILL